MGDFKVDDTITDLCYITDTDGVAATGLSPNFYSVDPSGNRTNEGGVSEIGGGWYKASVTVDEAGIWGTEWTVAGSYKLYLAINKFNVGGGVIAEIKSLVDTEEGSGSFSYLDAGGEQTVFTITTSTRKKLHSIFLDLNTLTQGTTIKIKHKIDGSNYRVIETLDWTTDDDDGVYFNKSLAINQDLQVTMEEAADEGAARSIPYYYILGGME